MGLAPGCTRVARARPQRCRSRSPERGRVGRLGGIHRRRRRGVGDRRGVVVVGHSLGGFTAPLVCVRVPVDLLILVAATIPSPGELFADWWANVGYEGSGTTMSSTTTSLRSLQPRQGGENGTRTRRRYRSRGPSRPGPRRRRGTSLPRRPHVPGRLGATARPRTPRHRPRRNQRRPLHQPQPSA